MIRIQGLHKFFNKGRSNEIHVINDISLDLPEKGMVAIFGKSGCGKTTLLNVIGGLDKYAEGTLTIENQSIRENTDVIRNKYIGYIFQNYNLNKEESCFDNVADALRLCGMTDEAEIESRVTAALANVGMERYAKRTPDTLSGGQQQRIAIARAIVKNPRIILADEPTGNLDEANTVMIMDLLKAIARDHLVLLVTHEANLVDFYCDTVIELQDGKVVGTKQNASATGFAARDKNDIYLGELSRREIADEGAEIEYYGDLPEKPVKIKIVNHGGKLYIEIGTAKVQIIDGFSEIKLREGVYEEKENANAVSEDIDMSKLPPVEGTRFGRLFSLKSSIKSGYVSNFKNRKKGKKVLRGCLALFATVIVFMSAVFGTAFGSIIDAKNSYNNNIFYVYTPDAEVSSKLNAAVGNSSTGIDYVRLTWEHPEGDTWVTFRTGTFETFEQLDYESNFRTNAVYLDVTMVKDKKLVEGKKENLSNEEILITTKVADALLEKSTLGYISERKDLIGLVSSMLSVDGKYLRIAGIVESGEPAIYLTEIAMAKYLHQHGIAPYTTLASDYGVEVAPGEAILAIKNQRAGVEYPKIGETIKIQGRDIKIVGIKENYVDYHRWIEANGIKKLDEFSYFADIIKQTVPETIDGKENPDFLPAVEAAMETRYFEYYEYFYSEAKEYYEDRLFFEPQCLEYWLYVEKDVELAKYLALPLEYYKAYAFYNMYGRYPTQAELQKNIDALPDAYEAISEYINMYESEFWSQNREMSFNINTYMVSEADYVAFSKQLGETHPTAKDAGGNNIEYEKAVSERAIVDVEIGNNDVMVDLDYISDMYFTVIHSTDPDKTEAWIESEFSDLTAPYSYMKTIVTPDSLFDTIIEQKTEQIVTSLITMAVILVLMSVCMYFIMRSSLMNRIKEVGIYRAIGVSKKNLVFKFFIEAIVLTTLTVLIGYLLTSGFLFLCLGMSSMIAEIFYYPIWLAGAVLAVLYAISLFFGTLPILSLLRKTPSEILAKYDI